MTLDEAELGIGRLVIYYPGHGSSDEGVITSVGDSFVFVRYGSDIGSLATPAGKLRFSVEVG